MPSEKLEEYKKIVEEIDESIASLKKAIKEVEKSSEAWIKMKEQANSLGYLKIQKVEELKANFQKQIDNCRKISEDFFSKQKEFLTNSERLAEKRVNYLALGRSKKKINIQFKK